MRRGRSVFAAAVSVLVLALPACDGGTSDTTPPEASPPEASPTEAASPEPPPEEGTPLAEVTDEDFDHDNFATPTNIDNQWFPITPGTRYTYTGGITDEGERLGHKVVFTVTDLTKVIDGVRSVVIWDLDYTGGEIVESELAFFAQDNDGNVWLMGEYPEEWEEDEFQGAPDTWISGVGETRAGIAMRAEPQVGTPAYYQGWSPPIEFMDRAKVFRMGEETCVPVDCYSDVLITDEWNPDEKGAHQRKFYAPGVGHVRVGWAGPKEKEKEILVLTKIEQLSPKAIEKLREQALEMEKRAYKVSKDVYGETPPLEGA